MLVKPEWLEVRKTEAVEIIVNGVDLLEEVRKSKVKNDEVVKVVEEMKRAGVKMLKDKEWREVDSIMYKEEKVYVPRDDKLRAEIIRLHHDTLVEGHRGQWKTMELVTRNFWWSGITKEVKQYMEECDACQCNKNHTEQPAGKLMPNSIPEKPWTHISADFITKLPLAQGYDSILVVVDWLTKMIYFILTIEKMSAEELARLFRDNVWKLYGLSESIISDREPQFVAGLMKELNEMLGIKSKLLTVFYPQTDRQTERVNQELEQYLRMFIDHRQEQWLEWLGTAEFVYNNKAYSSTRMSPFKANYGQDPRMGFKRKIHRSGKICEENKGDTRRGKSSTKKSIGKYEEVCRQEEIRCR